MPIGGEDWQSTTELNWKLTSSYIRTKMLYTTCYVVNECQRIATLTRRYAHSRTHKVVKQCIQRYQFPRYQCLLSILLLASFKVNTTQQAPMTKTRTGRQQMMIATMTLSSKNTSQFLFSILARRCPGLTCLEASPKRLAHICLATGRMGVMNV